MQPVLRLNRPAVEGRLTQAAAYLGIAGGFDGFYDFVGEMNTLLGIPPNLTALGVSNPNVEALVTSALQDPSCGGNPVELTRANVTQLLQECL